jgi:protocatechuate 3,4-dioxygenase beta subunit
MSRSKAAAVVALLLVVAAAPVAVGSAAAAEQVTLTVTVVDDGGDPVSGADLAVSWDGGSASETTRANGQALVDVPRGSNPEIAVDHDTYMRNHPFVVENATAESVEIPVSLSGTLTITVNGSTGPVDDATVSLFRDGRYATTTKTDSDGMATTDPVERGDYGLRVTKPGYYTNGSQITIRAQTSTSRTIRPGAVQLRFNVTDDHFSPARPVENATVDIAQVGTSLRTLENGHATTSVAVNRKYDVEITKEAYESVETSLQIKESARVVDVTLQRTPEISIAAANDRVVVGETTLVTVTNEYDEPVEGATVTVDGSAVGTTDESGELDVPIEADGNQTVAASVSDLSASMTIEGIKPSERTTTEPPTTTETTTTTGGGGPGFSVLTGLVALAGAGIALLARRS